MKVNYCIFNKYSYIFLTSVWRRFQRKGVSIIAVRPAASNWSFTDVTLEQQSWKSSDSEVLRHISFDLESSSESLQCTRVSYNIVRSVVVAGEALPTHQ